MGFAETFKALSDPVRREILMLLRGGTAGLLFTVLGLLLYSKVKKQMILYV